MLGNDESRSRLPNDVTKATVFLLDAKHFARHQARIALNSLGFWSISDTHDLQMAPGILAERKFDLIIAGIEKANDGITDFVRQVRRQEFGRDPFIPVILTAWSPPEELVNRALNSGADDLLIWPFSIGQLGDRIQALISSRKKFVATDTYLGPDRRGEDARDQTYETIEVPNSLRASVEGDKNAEPDPRKISATMQHLQDEKVRCEARRINGMTLRVLEYYWGDRGDLAQQYIPMVQQLTKQFRKSIVGSHFAHLGELAASVDSVIEEFIGNIGSGVDKDLALLEKTSQALLMGAEQANASVDAAYGISGEIRTRSKRNDGELDDLLCGNGA
jgi:DNA-binding response OmpR family regulator